MLFYKCRVMRIKRYRGFGQTLHEGDITADIHLHVFGGDLAPA